MIVIIKHISIEGPGIIGEFFKNMPWEVKGLELAKGDRLPQDLCGINAIISLGSPMSVYEKEKYPFLEVEDKFLKKAIKEEIPILGICLGSQLLAKACGAKVKKAKQEEVGWHKLSLTVDGKKDLLFQGLSNQLNVFEWHRDTFEIPNNGTLLASSHHCRNQAFPYGRNGYGFQFHVEVTTDMIESWIDEYLNSDDETKITDAEKMLMETYEKKDQFVRQANRILLNFSRLILREVF